VNPKIELKEHLEIQVITSNGPMELLRDRPETLKEGHLWLKRWKREDSLPKRLVRVTTVTVTEEIAS
jgi:hypothetical protein